MKRIVFFMLLAVGTFLSRLFLKRKTSNQNNSVETLHYAGIPDQIDSTDDTQLENAKMVSEGSQFGVQYYNKAVNPSLNGRAEEVHE